MSDMPRTLIAAEVAAAWAGGETECRVNWAKAAQLPPMPSELLLVAKDPLIGQAIAKWAQSVCEQTVGLRSELAAASAECERMRQELDHARDWLKESRENGHRLLEAADGWKLSAAEWQKRAESAEADAGRANELLLEIRRLVQSGEVKLIDAGGGVWTWPDRVDAAIDEARKC